MIKNYLLIAFRNLIKHKGYAFINLFGLAIGIALSVIIMLYIQDELSYDTYHKKADRIYRVVQIIEPAEESSSLPFPARGMLINEFPAMIEETAGLFNFQSNTLAFTYKDKEDGKIVQFNEPNVFLADSNIFNVFDIPFIQGDPNTALSTPNSVVLTKDAAQKYFQDENPIGKTLYFEFNQTLTVTGVIENCPSNSHFTYDILVSMTTLRNIWGNLQETNWYWNPVWSYVVLKEGVSKEQVESKLDDFVNKYFHDAIKKLTTLYLQPLTDIHLHSNIDYEIEANSDISLIYIFGGISFFVIIIASINFINLSTARSMNRAREVGVRKVMGAFRKQLIGQFISESLLLTVIAILLAAPLITLLLPFLNGIAGKDLVFNPLTNMTLNLLMVALIIIIGILAGMYPAFYLSSFQPVRVLKGSISKGEKGLLFRKILVISQFAISIFLIIITLIAYEQIGFMRNAHLGFNKEEIIVIPADRSSIAVRYDEFRDRLLQHSGVKEVSASDFVPGTSSNTSSYIIEGYPEDTMVNTMFVRINFPETLEIPIVAGRSFSKIFPRDDSLSVLVNESFIKQYDMKSPEEAIGKKVYGSGLLGSQSRIVGVMKDFHYAPLRQPINPVVVRIAENPGQKIFMTKNILIRISTDKLQDVLAFIETQFSDMAKDRPFEFKFLDEELDKQYKSEKTLGQVSASFSVIAIIIACLGLVGLSSFSTQQRTKEIGIRKALGASVSGIITLLSKEFLTLVLLANLLAAPLAYYAVNSWLDNFANKITLSPAPFIIAALITFVIAFLSMGYQTLKAALVNPVKSLKYE